MDIFLHAKAVEEGGSRTELSSNFRKGAWPILFFSG